MPLYEYQCPQCGRFELIRKFSDAPLCVCPTCGGEVQKLHSAPAIQFKGSGWYVNDYARKSSGGEGPKGESAKAGEAAKAGEGATKSDSGSSKSTESKDSSASAKSSSSAK